MLKPIAAGLMCLGFVTLGVAMTQGQDGKTDLFVIDGKVGATEVKVNEAKGNSPAGGTAAAEVSNRGDTAIRDTGFLFGRGMIGSTPHVVDSQTRETLEKVLAALKEQIQKLESEGKKEEAQSKSQSLRAIESLLRSNPRRAEVRFFNGRFDPEQTIDELRKLEARRLVLSEKFSKLPEGAAGDREKIQQEINKVEREMAEKHRSLTAPFLVGGSPPQFGTGQSGMGMQPPQLTQQPPGTPQLPSGYSFPFSAEWPIPAPSGINSSGAGSSEAMAMLRKSEALSQAAAQLKKNGLDEQAKSLIAQAEQFKTKADQLIAAESEKRRAQGGFGGGASFGAGRGPRGFGGFAGMAGGPPMELHRSIHELQEQIQQLRKEVGELRELLQRKP